MFDPAVPDVLRKHRHAVQHHDPPELWLEASVQERRQAGADRGPGLRHGECGGHDARRGVGLHRVVDGAEQRVLAREVVVEGPPGHPRPLDDLLDRRRRVAAFGEQLASDRDE